MSFFLLKYNELQKKLNNIKLIGFEKIQIGYTMSYPLSNILFGGIGTTVHQIINIFKGISFDYYFFEYESLNAQILFAITPTYLERPDHLKTMQNIADTAHIYDAIWPIKKRKFHFNIKRIKLICLWLFQLRKISLKTNEKLFLVSCILSSFNYLNAVRNTIDFNNYTAVVVRMDGQVYDNVISQYANLCNCITITVQDGYEIRKPKEIEKDWQLQAKIRGSVSDYCIAWSDYYCNIIQEVVPVNQKIIPLGIPKYIELPNNNKNESDYYFAILLDFDNEDSSNDALLDFANTLYKKNEIPYIARCHPRQKDSIFNDFIPLGCCIELSPNQKDFFEFVKNAEFVIGCNSTSVLESSFINPKTYRLVPSINTDMLKDCSFPLIFKTYQELLYLVKNKCRVDEKYLFHVCGPKNVKQQYEKFFQDIINGTILEKNEDLWKF